MLHNISLIYIYINGTQELSAFQTAEVNESGDVVEEVRQEFGTGLVLVELLVG